MGLFDSFRKKKLQDGLEKTRTGFSSPSSTP